MTAAIATAILFAASSVISGKSDDKEAVILKEQNVTKKDFKRSPGTLRVLYWNIQNGMWADQANDYKTFVEWVQKYDPDVCVWCEAKTIYKDNTNKGLSSGEPRFLPGGWKELAAAYGHNYVATGGERDNYPQEITSKYEISTLLRITDSDVEGRPISHGAALHSLKVNGMDIYFVTLHTWPQAYGFGIPKEDREASKAKHDGDLYREFELRYIMSQTVNNQEFTAQKDWIVMGDFNSRSRLDNWFMKYSEDDTRLLAQDVMINETSLVDIIHEKYPGKIVSTTAGDSRIDYMYASMPMFDRVVKAKVLTDEWTDPQRSELVPAFHYPSDHRPILVDFKLPKSK